MTHIHYDCFSIRSRSIQPHFKISRQNSMSSSAKWLLLWRMEHVWAVKDSYEVKMEILGLNNKILHLEVISSFHLQTLTITASRCRWGASSQPLAVKHRIQQVRVGSRMGTKTTSAIWSSSPLWRLNSNLFGRRTHNWPMIWILQLKS